MCMCVRVCVCVCVCVYLLLASGEEMYHIEFVIARHNHLRQRALLLGRLDVCQLCA